MTKETGHNSNWGTNNCNLYMVWNCRERYLCQKDMLHIEIGILSVK